MITATIATITPGDVPVLLSVGEPVATVPEEEAVVVVVVGLGVEDSGVEDSGVEEFKGEVEEVEDSVAVAVA